MDGACHQIEVWIAFDHFLCWHADGRLVQQQFTSIHNVLQVTDHGLGEVWRLGQMFANTIQRGDVGIVGTHGCKCYGEIDFFLTKHLVLLMVVVQCCQFVHSLCSSLVAQPPVEVQVLHLHLFALDVVALQVGEECGNLSVAHYQILRGLRSIQAQHLERRLDAELRELTTC